MKLELGCGNKKREGYIGIDIYDWSRLYRKDEFIQGKVPEILVEFKDDNIDEVLAEQFIEHIGQNRVIETFNEIYRILKVGGLFKIYVPPTTGRGAFCDPTHKSYWNEWSFRYYDKTWEGYWLSKSYGIGCNFKTLEIRQLNEITLYACLEKV